jgi:hypothetical protein
VALGFGRVYVNCPDGFNYDAWMRRLDRGESFVTTRPMLLIRVNGKGPGTTFTPGEGKSDYWITGEAVSALPLDRFEVVVNGKVLRTIKSANKKRDPGGYSSELDERLTIESSSWLAVRCYESHPKGRVRFAHTAPFHIEIPGKPLRPRAAEIDFLIRRVEEQIARSKDILAVRGDGRIPGSAAGLSSRESGRGGRSVAGDGRTLPGGCCTCLQTTTATPALADVRNASCRA